MDNQAKQIAKQIRQWFETWWDSREGEPIPLSQKDTHWAAFRAGVTRCLTDVGTPQARAAFFNNRVEMAPHTDEWMQGDRYGSIQARRVSDEILVRLDKSKRLIWVKPEHITKEFTA